MNDSKTTLILVDEKDSPQGTGEKLLVHQKGLLHRAFSVFILRKRSELEVLLQQRCDEKYHCGGLWANACCGHPQPFQKNKEAAEERLFYEIGVRCELSKAGIFHYYAEFDNHLIEHEIDHVFYGYWEGEPKLHPEEAKAYRWVKMSDLVKLLGQPDTGFAVWVKPALAVLKSHLME
ncbi:MAG TPA: isopentenyl-diphosphate Delta-isomerase [Gammaproteobacteria bacterium]|nr:isopentenyl-diphosphate Delta-isomerase [Gammaproteobacteria bacterium]